MQSTTSQLNEQSTTTDTKIPLGNVGTSSAGAVVAGYCLVDGCNTSGVKIWNGLGAGNGTAALGYPTGGFYNTASTISSVSLFSDSGNFDSGNLYVYASA